MKRTTLTCVLALVGVLALASVAAAGPGRSASDDIRATERALLKATVDADAPTLASILAPDFQVIDPFGEPESRNVYMANIGGGVDFRVFKPLTPFKIMRTGNTAIVRYRAAIETAVGPDTLSHRAWVTDVLEQRKGSWLVVWSHVTATPNDPGLFIQALKPR